MFSVLVSLVLIVMCTGCKKEDDKVLNKITVSGNTTTTYNQVYTPEDGHYYGPYEIQCVNTTYGSYIWIDLSPESVLYIEMILPSNATALPLGTLSPTTGECQEGFIAHFYPPSIKKNGGLALTTGTVTIKKEGDNYSVDVNLGFHSLSGGGTLKGNFYGPLPMIQNGAK